MIIEFAKPFAKLFAVGRYKVFYGGRGGAKTWHFARALLLLSLLKKIKVLCAREYMNSIKDSVHAVIKDQIDRMGLSRFFENTASEIRCTETGSKFIFKGLHLNDAEIKSTEKIDYCWVEEAQAVTKSSWDNLVLTIRTENEARTEPSEIWISFNPHSEDDPTYQRFIKNASPETIQERTNWDSNPFFPLVLNKERLWMMQRDPGAYEHIWSGACRVLGDNVIFAGRFTVDCFETPTNPPPCFYYGCDWGRVDPTVLIRCYVSGPPGEPHEEELWIDYEAYAVGVELNDIPALFDRVPRSREALIKGDSARGDVISYLNKSFGFRIEPTMKKGHVEDGQKRGSIEDGIEHIRGFKQVHIHQRCVHTAEEFRLYAYKRDPRTGQILEEILDRNNHCIDSLRYALEDYIRTSHKNHLEVWKKLGQGFTLPSWAL